MVKIFLILMFLVILFGAPKFGGSHRGVVLTIPNGLSQTKRYTESVDELVERYYRERDFEKALTYEEQAILEMKYGSMDTDTFCRLNAMLGGCYVSLGECEKGKPYIDTALKEYEESGETIPLRRRSGRLKLWKLRTGELSLKWISRGSSAIWAEPFWSWRIWIRRWRCWESHMRLQAA